MEHGHFISDNLGELMAQNGVSSTDLAKLTGIPKANISRLLSDPNCNPTILTLLPIAKYFEVSVSQLIGDDVFSSNLNMSSEDKKKMAKVLSSKIKRQLLAHVDTFIFEPL